MVWQNELRPAAFINFEGTFYRYAKRYEETQDWQPPESKAIRRGPSA